jgi:Tol biopolymer transport system component
LSCEEASPSGCHGGNPHARALSPRNVIAARWAPNGRSLALIVSLALNAGEPAWAPDSKRIAFVRFGRPSGAVSVIRADGAGARDLAPWQRPRFYAAVGGNDVKDVGWSPRGDTIAYSTGTDGRIHVIRADGGGDRAIAAGVEPAWSPSGRSIAYLHADRVEESQAVQWSLRVGDPAGGTVRRLVAAPEVGIPAWTRRGDAIAYAAKTPARGIQLYVVTLRRRRLMLTREPRTTLYRALFWSRDGRRVFYDAYVPDSV